MFTYGDSGLLAENLSYANSYSVLAAEYPKCKGTENHLFFFFFFFETLGSPLNSCRLAELAEYRVL